jgi:hypothetical protein
MSDVVCIYTSLKFLIYDLSDVFQGFHFVNNICKTI